MSNYGEIENLVQQVRHRIEHGSEWRDEDRYHLSRPSGGGYAVSYTLEDALSEAIWLTSDECRQDRCLTITNPAHQVIAIVFDENVFVPVEMLKPPVAGEEG